MGIFGKRYTRKEQYSHLKKIFKNMQQIKMTLLVSACILFFSCQGNQQQDNSTTENETLETIFNRKSVREYSNREIVSEKLDKLLRAGMSAPSSRDRRPWHFIVVSDKALLESLGGQLKTASMLKNANKAIIVCGDSLLSDNCWFLDCSAAAENILLAAESMGIGATLTAVYPYEDRSSVVNNIFQLPENIHPLAIIPLGYPVGKNAPKNKYDETRIHHNKW